MLALPLLLACVPASPTTRDFPGPGVTLRQTVSGRAVQLELVDRKGARRWKLDAEAVFDPVFSPDGRFVAEASTIDTDLVRVFTPEGRVEALHPLSLASEDEIAAMGDSSCGTPWFGGMRFDGSTLVVLLNQAPMRPPMMAPDPTPKLEVRIDVERGAMTRTTTPTVFTVEGLIARYRSGPGARREAAERLVLKVQRGPRPAPPSLAGFVREELPKTADSAVQELLLSLLDEVASDDDGRWLAGHALEARWPPGRVLSVLERLPDKVRARAFARTMLERHLGDDNARIDAVRLLAPTPECLEYVALGMSDSSSYVAEGAGLVLPNVPATEESYAFVLAHVDQESARRAMIALFVAPPRGATTNPFAARFEQSCDAALQKQWPGCEAWTGATADARGDRELAAKRYRHALVGLGTELEQNKSWSGEVESFFNVHVRLALLARDARKTSEVAAHLEAMKRSRWWEQARVDCSSGLPRAFDPTCDGGTYRERLVERLLESPDGGRR